MSAVLSITLMLVIATIPNRLIQDTFGINGTCGESNMTKGGENQTLLSILKGQGYFKNLTSDNPRLAELLKMC